MENKPKIDMKNHITRLCTRQVMLAMLAAPLAAQDYNFGGGDGTTANPYQITTPAQLDSIRDYSSASGSNYLDNNFVLMNDLDFDGYNYADGTKEEGGEGWLPIGQATYDVDEGTVVGTPFTGTFNGKGNVIRNVYIHRPDADHGVGLFSALTSEGATIDSLGLEDAEVTGFDQVGALAGISGMVKHCYATGGQVVSSTGTNGLTGTGGLVGIALFGDSINYSYASNLVIGVNNTSGGLVGLNNSTVSYSHASGQVVGGSSLGGIAGFSSGTITDSYSTALVIGASGSVGGLVGGTDGGKIRRSYACGRVEGSGKVGGLVGRSLDPITDSYWNSTTNDDGLLGLGEGDSDGVTSLTTAHMYEEDSFKGFDFTNDWSPPTEDEHFPHLRGVGRNAQLLLYSPVASRGSAAIGTPFSLDVEVLPPTLADGEGNAIDTVFASTNTAVATVDNSGEVTAVKEGATSLTVSRAGNATYAPVEHLRTLVISPFSMGTGTATDPYQIETEAQLDFIRDYGLGANLLDDHYALANDLDFSGYEYDDDDKHWLPIGNEASGFLGTFNGRGHVIAHLKATRPTEDHVGLFGYVSSGRIDSLGLENVEITGRNNVGSMVGFFGIFRLTADTISNSYAVGQVSGREDVGGLVGNLFRGHIRGSYASVQVDGVTSVGGLVGLNNARIENGYATGQVLGSENVGGLVGENSVNSPTIATSYAVGRVEGTTNVGGLVGNVRGTIRNSYWNTTTSGMDMDAGKGLTTEHMYEEDSFDGFDFDDVWLAPTAGEHFPQLRGVSKNGQVMFLPSLGATNDLGGTLSVAPTLLLPPTLSEGGSAIDTVFVSANPDVATVDDHGEVTVKAVGVTSLTVSRGGNTNYAPLSLSSSLLVHPFPAGAGTKTDPYQVRTPAQLDAIRDYGGGANLLDDHYALVADLDFKDYGYTDADKGWLPIGHDTNNEDNDFVGVSFTGTLNGRGYAIRHLRAHRGEEHYVGLFGQLAGMGRLDSLGLETVDIIGRRFVGGLVGETAGNSVVKNSYVSGSVSAVSEGGGLVGYHRGDTISSSYAACNVVGELPMVSFNIIGGLVGNNRGIIADSYSYGYVLVDGVNEGNDIGGLVSFNGADGKIFRSYATSRVAGVGSKGGLVSDNRGVVRRSYWNTEISGEDVGIVFSDRSGSIVGVTGLTTAQMYDVADDDGDGENYIQYFDGFDFEDIWLPPTEDVHFPQLRGVSKNAQVLVINPLSSVRVDSVFSLKAGNAEGDNYVLLPPMLFEEDGVTAISVELESSATSVVRVGANNEATAVGAGTTALTLRRAGNDKYIPVGFSESLLVHPFSTGSGTAADPFKVSTPQHLDFIRGGQAIDFLHSHYEVTADLDFSGYDYNDAVKGWQPIGEQGEAFHGVLNGKGYVVSGLRASRLTEDYVGLFGVVGKSGRIDSLGVEDTRLFGGDYVGVMAGRNRGIISHSYGDGSLEGDANVGGLVGANDSTIQYSYASARVEGDANVGGLAGVNKDTIQYSYAYGRVVGNTMVGGLVGLDDGGVYRASYWNTETSGQTVGVGSASSDPTGVAGLDNTEMYSDANFTGFDFTAEGAWLSSLADVHFPLLRGVNGQQWVTLSTVGNTTIEEGGSVSFMIERAGRPTDDLAVRIGFEEGTSKFVSASTPRSVTFTGQDMTAMFTVTTDEDEVDEDDGSVVVLLVDSLGYEVGSSSSAGSRAAIEVADNDLAKVSVASAGDVVEGADAVFTLSRTTDEGALSVNVEVTQEGEYTSRVGSHTVDFIDGSLTAQLPVPTDDDDVDERNGTITATVVLSQEYRLGDPVSATLSVADNDGEDDPDVSIASAGDVEEGEDAVFTLSRTTASLALTVNVMVTEEGDYIQGAAPKTVSFEVGETTATLSIPTEDDNLAEEDGVITAVVVLGVGYAVVEPSQAEVAVSDNEFQVISVASGGDIAEGSDAVFTLTRTLTSGTQSVNVEVMEQGDYIMGAVPSIVTFADELVSATLTIRTEDDAVDELSGAITVTVVAGTGYALGDPSSAVVAVRDDDGEDDPDVSIASMGDVTEGEDAVFTLSRTTAALALTVNVEVAEQGDYIMGTAPTTVSFEVGESTSTLTIPTEDDAIDESNGRITATVASGLGYAVVAPSSAVVAVSDNDETVPDPDVTIASAGDVTEGEDAVFTLTRSSGSGNLTVNVSVTEQGSYISGTAPTMVSFTGGSMTATLAVSTANDAIDEPGGAITATVTSGTGYAVGDPSSAVVAVADNDGAPDPDVSIVSDGDVTEGEDAVFTLTRSSGSGALTVNVIVTEQGEYIDGTAPSTVAFAANVTTATLTVSTDDDDVDEADGSITATVMSGVGYEVGDPSSATLTISDNDGDPVGLSEESGVILYPNPVGRYLHVRLPGGGSVWLYTLAGRLEETYSIRAGREQVSLDVSGLSSGIYVVTLVDSGGQATQYRVVKE